MAMEQYVQETEPQNKEDQTSLNRWKPSSEAVDNGPENGPTRGFDCNICLDAVHDPVVTLCGHLYCWPCIYRWMHHHQTEKRPQCPVCKNDVSHTTIVPLYGRGQTATKPRPKDQGIRIPSRPPPSPRGGVHPTHHPPPQLNHRGYAPPPPPVVMPGLGGGMTMMINPTSPTTGMLGEMVYETIFGNPPPPPTALYAYRDSYNLAAIGTQRGRRHMVQADRSLSRVCFFLLCCITLCLLLF